MYRQELGFLCSAHHLMMLYISMKFHENILNKFSSHRVDMKLPLSSFEGEKLQNYIDKSYGSCVLHIV